MARNQSTSAIVIGENVSPLAGKVAEANARRLLLAGQGSANVLPTTYYSPTKIQAENLYVALIADADFSSEAKQEALSSNVLFIFRKRNLVVGEQPTILRYGYNSQVKEVVLTVTGTSMPAGFSLEGVKVHEIVAAEKANDKRKATAKAGVARDEAFANLGF